MKHISGKAVMILPTPFSIEDDAPIDPINPITGNLLSIIKKENVLSFLSHDAMHAERLTLLLKYKDGSSYIACFPNLSIAQISGTGPLKITILSPVEAEIKTAHATNNKKLKDVGGLKVSIMRDASIKTIRNPCLVLLNKEDDIIKIYKGFYMNSSNINDIHNQVSESSFIYMNAVRETNNPLSLNR